MFEYFYNEIFRKTLIGFGSLFNGIEVKKTDQSGQVTSITKVPLAYGPTQKFLARIDENPSLDKAVQITLPRMSFELVGIRYDPTRKASQTQTFLAPSTSDSGDIRKTYLPVPYNLEFQLSIFTKLNDDMLQIIEQILPYFQPAYTLTINLIDIIGEKRDIPIIFEGISMQDDYEGDYTTRRALIYTLRFTAKTYIFGPIADVTKDVIRKVSIGYIAGDKTNTPSREVSYSVEPRAIQSYTNNVVTNLANDVSDTDTLIEVNSSAGITVGSYITIDNEELKVSSVSGNKLTVVRGADCTTATAHVSGSEINLITQQDNALIPVGDDFGFDGNL